MGNGKTFIDARDFLLDTRDDYQRLVRRLEFADLPKTISGKIRRVELRGQESERSGQGARKDAESMKRRFVNGR